MSKKKKKRRLHNISFPFFFTKSTALITLMSSWPEPYFSITCVDWVFSTKKMCSLTCSSKQIIPCGSVSGVETKIYFHAVNKTEWLVDHTNIQLTNKSHNDLQKKQKTFSYSEILAFFLKDMMSFAAETRIMQQKKQWGYVVCVEQE